MTTPTVSPVRASTFLYSAQNFTAGIEPAIFKKDDGVVVVQRQAVFRTGTFRDSWGDSTTWEALHLDQMLAHFNMLRDRHLFENVPVRDGHPSFIFSGMEGSGKVLGWHTGLKVEEIEAPIGKYNFLLADYEITDEEAKAKVLNKHYRNRSSEVGRYVTNDEAEFWPVYMGMAFVDIPAIEGLNGFSKPTDSGNTKVHIFMADKEAPQVAGTETTTPAAPAAPAAPVVPAAPAVPAPAVPAAPAQPFKFKVRGAETVDFAAVQTHIEALELFQHETQEAARVSFVSGLATDNKILASQIPTTTEFAKGLSPEQFTSWKATFEAAPAVPVLGPQGTVPQVVPNGAAASDDEQAYEIARETVKNHQRANMPQDVLEKTSSYKRMIALGTKLNKELPQT